MADAEHIKLDDGSVIDVADAVARQKVGSAELQTTAKDCSGAINELKGTLDVLGTINQISTSSFEYDTIDTFANVLTFNNLPKGKYIFNGYLKPNISNSAIYITRLGDFQIRNSAVNGGGSNVTLMFESSSTFSISLRASIPFTCSITATLQYIKIG